jgi:hypothetical protein
MCRGVEFWNCWSYECIRGDSLSPDMFTPNELLVATIEFKLRKIHTYIDVPE